MKWQHISEYRAELGRVLVWLEWREYSRAIGNLEPVGEAQFAYTMEAGGRAVWVEAKDCIPIETTGRRVTHFCRPSAPENGVSAHA